MNQTDQTPTTVTARFRAIMVDDNDAFRRVLSRNLENIGCEVTSACKASDFLSEIVMAKPAFDFAVVDIRLPDLNGDQIISWLRQSEHSGTRSLPVLVITGYPNDLPEDLLVDGKSLVLLAKPFRQSDLERAIAQLMKARVLH